MQISDVVCGITSPILEPHWSFSTGLPYLAFGPAAFVQFIMFSPVFWIATVIHFFLQDLYRQFIILYLAEVMVGMGEETVLVEVAAVHELEVVLRPWHQQVHPVVDLQALARARGPRLRIQERSLGVAAYPAVAGFRQLLEPRVPLFKFGFEVVV